VPASARVARRCDLLDAPDGACVGEFVVTALTAVASFGAQGAPVSMLEMQTYRIGDDTLFCMGAGRVQGAEQVSAVLGGTGRFAGVRGICRELELVGEASSRGSVEFRIELFG
jgi:hypothetical protein